MKFVRDVAIIIVVAVAISALIQVTMGSVKVYGVSMFPNIQHGEYIIVSKATYFFHTPQQGDIIVFHSPHNSSSDLIKRIIALPGDSVEIKDGKVFVNNSPLEERYIVDPPRYIYPRQEVSEGHYFVLGDNRNNSADSHTGWTMPRENIIGKAWLTYWPPQKWRLIEHYTPNTGEQNAELNKANLVAEKLCLLK